LTRFLFIHRARWTDLSHSDTTPRVQYVCHTAFRMFSPHNHLLIYRSFHDAVSSVIRDIPCRVKAKPGQSSVLLVFPKWVSKSLALQPCTCLHYPICSHTQCTAVLQFSTSVGTQTAHHAQGLVTCICAPRPRLITAYYHRFQ
jgi:hypothetical protein